MSRAAPADRPVARPPVRQAPALRRWAGSPRALLVTGAVGSALAAIGSYWTAATPAWFRTDPPPVIDLFAPQALPARVAWYLGLLLLVAAWLVFGRLLWAGADVRWRTLRTAALAWGAPFVLAVPVASRDLWAYAAQARVAATGHDPYRVGPAVLHDVFAANVTPRWAATPSPYGPLWTLVGRGLAAPAGQHELLAVLLLRLPAALGLVLLAGCLGPLAGRVGADRRVALWLVAANPLLLVHGVGGGHNDLPMIALGVAGALVAVGGGPRWRALLLGGVLVGAGAAIKLPVVVVAPFLPLLWARYAGAGTGRAGTGRAGTDRAGTDVATSWRPLLRARAGELAGGVAASLGGALAVIAVTTGLAGYGLGWLATANTGSHGGGAVVGGLLVVVLVVLWLLAVRGRPLLLLAVALLATVLCSRDVQVWYWLWPLPFAALVIRSRQAIALAAAGSMTEVFFIRPNGNALPFRPEAFLLVSLLVVWVVHDRHWRPFERTAAVPADRD